MVSAQSAETAEPEGAGSRAAGNMDRRKGAAMPVPLIETKDLKKYFRTALGDLHAVDGVCITIEKGRTLGVVGESGCGKSTLGRLLLRLIEPTAGQVLYEGENILQFSSERVLQMRRKMQIIFQDPYASLNPRMTVGQIIAEPLKVNKACKTKTELEARVSELMEVVGLAERLYNAYPHELDGGRRQRIGIARALALKPEFIVCDEPVSALDVSIQAQILNLMMDLQEQMALTYMFITHDLSVVRHISSEIAVMYLGQCVERAATKTLFEEPLHPYTKALLGAVPVPDPDARLNKKEIIRGEITSPINPEPGCRFAARCPEVRPECRGTDIPLTPVGDEHFIACTKYQ